MHYGEENNVIYHIMILKKTGDGPVIIEKHHKAKAVLLPSEQYERMQKLLDSAEDLVLGHMAAEREKQSKASDYIDIRDLLQCGRSSFIAWW